MKVRESSMPEQDQWESYFDPPAILTKLELTNASHNVVEFGSGYGTFTIAAAQVVAGTVYALDIEPSILRAAQVRTDSLGLTNIEYSARDFVSSGSGLADGAADYAMLFNILHTEDPVGLLREAWRNVQPAGKIAVIHWNYDPEHRVDRRWRSGLDRATADPGPRRQGFYADRRLIYPHTTMGS